MKYHIHLDDYHPGEYTTWRAKNYPNVEVNFTECDYDTDDSGQSLWDLRSDDLRALITLFDDLVESLATVTWHWYGLGGDDNCYDYWPNTMDLALKFYTQLKEAIAQAVPPEDRYHNIDDDYLQRYHGESLTNVYWLARMRYSHQVNPVDDSNPRSTYIEDADQYFESDLLSKDGFGPKPAWIPDLNTQRGS